jgi:hypothetical protein
MIVKNKDRLYLLMIKLKDPALLKDSKTFHFNHKIGNQVHNKLKK